MYRDQLRALRRYKKYGTMRLPKDEAEYKAMRSGKFKVSPPEKMEHLIDPIHTKVYNELEPMMRMTSKFANKLKKEDGVTEYSRSWWRNFRRTTYVPAKNKEDTTIDQIHGTSNFGAYMSAVDETLAEIAYLKRIEGRGEIPLRITDSYKNLYEHIGQLYDESRNAA
jgi:hypothetical protein